MDKKSRRREQILAGIRAYCSLHGARPDERHADVCHIPFMADETELYAKPLRGRGYYVSSFREYEDALSKTGAKILDVKLSHGTDYQKDLFKKLQVSGPMVKTWFESIQRLPENNAVALLGLISGGSIKRVTNAAVEKAVSLIDKGEVFVFKGSIQELSVTMHLEALVDSESLNRYFDYGSYGAVLRKQISKQEAGDMDDEELGEAWVEDAFGGVEEITTEIKRQHFNTEGLAKELENCGMHQLVCGCFTWCVEPVVIQ